jgi:1-deoxy-D-xylulose-5-phosphate reductoisomerase
MVQQSSNSASKKRIRNVVIFGATGSIGTSALNVIRRHRDRFSVVGISANTNVEKLAEIAWEFAVENICIFDENALGNKHALFKSGTKFFTGTGGLDDLAKISEADSVLIAIVGISGIGPTIAAIESGKNAMLASKEVLVVAGKFVTECAEKNGIQLLPIDSEHNAIFQCLRGNEMKFVDKLILTASGGPFRNFSKNDLKNVTVEQAMRHPTWAMGKKITIDSATMANKGLEIMEARWLFNIPSGRIDAIVHPESVVHSMVKFCDGSIIAQMCPPNMEFPIANCLFYPDRIPFTGNSVDFAAQRSLTFFEIDVEKFPIIELARKCLAKETNACAAFHGANEVAVEKFLAKKIKFPQIYEIVARVLDAYGGEQTSSIENCIASVARARELAESITR